MKTIEKRNLWWTRFISILTIGLLIIIIILLLVFKSQCKNEIASLKAKISENSTKIDSLKESVDTIYSLMAVLINQNEKLINKLDTLNGNVLKLAKQAKQSERRENALANEISSMKDEIRNLAKKVDSLKNGFDVKLDSILNYVEENNSWDSVNFSDSKIITKKLSFTLTKKVFNKKHTKVVSESEILNYPSNLFYIDGRGFLGDSCSKLYEYMNPNSDSVNLIFSSIVAGNYAALKINKNGNGLLDIKEAEFALGAGGLLVSNKDLPWETTIPILEKTIDYDLKRRATYEILGGIIIAGVGTGGYLYFNNNPRATITVNDSDGNPFFYNEIQNEFGKVVSAGLAGAGTALFTKGIVDKVLSVKVNPTEIGIVYTIK